MRSMTGYGRAIVGIGVRTLTVQVRSVNRKMLDLAIKLPNEWEELETAISERIRGCTARGKVQVDLELSGGAGTAMPVWDEAAIGDALDRLSNLAAQRGIPFTPSPELLWSIANAQRSIEEAPAVEQVRGQVIAALDAALGDFVAMRAREGSTLLADLMVRIGNLANHVGEIAVRAPLVTSNYREQLLQRLRQAGLELELNDERVLREIALFADRCDLSEELTRFGSHLDQLRALFNSDGEMGRKAEFILQEMGREANTMGSKANDHAISRAVIELKNELERIREQIANVE